MRTECHSVFHDVSLAEFLQTGLILNACSGTAGFEIHHQYQYLDRMR